MLGTTPSRVVRCSLAAASVALVAACEGAAQEPSAQSTPDLGDDSRWDDEQVEVIETVEAYNDWYRTSLVTAVDPKLDMRTLRSIVAEPYATELGRQVSVQQSTGLEMRGEHIYTPRKVAVDGSSARLVACWDSTDGEVVNTYAKPEETVQPAPPTVNTFTFEADDGSDTGWKITRRTAGGKC